MLAGCSSASSEETQSTAAETTQAETAAQTTEASTEAAEETEAESEEVSLEAPGASETLRIGSLKGPHLHGGWYPLWIWRKKGESEGSYTSPW